MGLRPTQLPDILPRTFMVTGLRTLAGLVGKMTRTERESDRVVGTTVGPYPPRFGSAVISRKDD